ncbi:MAG: stress response translation initiation inhibitor YciH [Desulfatitalea sp.]|nr:stress response translation initiation inhibitor YciH [Desulfatitalea sp.]
MGNSGFVYSTETGRMCPDCSMPASKCTCKNGKSRTSTDNKVQGSIHIKREVKGRKGKTVTTISGLEKNESLTRRLATDLKKVCGTGGSVKEGVIVIQGDHREAIKALLEQQGFKTKLAGG